MPLHSEVRLTRLISHPNVCQVYDIGEVDGLHFLSMEYIDGEDFKILLRLLTLAADFVVLLHFAFILFVVIVALPFCRPGRSSDHPP